MQNIHQWLGSWLIKITRALSWKALKRRQVPLEPTISISIMRRFDYHNLCDDILQLRGNQSCRVTRDSLWRKFTESVLNQNHNWTPLFDSVFDQKNCAYFYESLPVLMSFISYFSGRRTPLKYKKSCNSQGSVTCVPCVRSCPGPG